MVNEREIISPLLYHHHHHSLFFLSHSHYFPQFFFSSNPKFPFPSPLLVPLLQSIVLLFNFSLSFVLLCVFPSGSLSFPWWVGGLGDFLVVDAGVARSSPGLLK
ncbi:hypothetical protein SDJN03_26399, partial [Cucurbita argyrosperma subsp. sororia]